MSEIDDIKEKKLKELTGRLAGGDIALKTRRIAVPSMRPGGLQAECSAHFGHCELFTLVDVIEGSIVNVQAIENVPHAQGGCMAPVNLLKEHGVHVLLVGGIGMRPLMGFRQAGIAVYSDTTGIVESAVREFVRGRLKPVGEDDVCGHNKG